MTSTTELIQKLDFEASKLAKSTIVQTAVGIAVTSENKQGIVWSYDDDRQVALEALVKEGGEPIGMVKLSEEDGKIAISSSLYPEFFGDLSMKSTLKTICREFGNRLLERCERAAGGPLKYRYFEDPSGWLQ